VRTILVAILSLLTTILPALPQEEGARSRWRETHWTAELPGGKIVLPYSSITSISLHNYEVDGAITVTEVTVGTMGSEIARFYYLEPITPESPAGVGQEAIEQLKDKVQELTQRAGQDLSSRVVRNYPESTHAHTIEFRLPSKADVERLYSHIESNYLQRRPAKFTLK
jgi:hypothetical protein